MNEPEPERTTGERSYGRRFLEELQSLVGPSAGLDYATIQKLKTADREGTIAVLRLSHYGELGFGPEAGDHL